MQFISPFFLFGLLALAIPVIIHLFNFRRYKTVYFSNVSLLKEVTEETNKTQKLKHYLVLASRMLALLFLVLAFAQPFIPGKDPSAQRGVKYSSFYLDNSFSMAATKDGVRLLDQAKGEIREIIDNWSADDKFQLITNEMSGRQQRLISKEEFLQELEMVEISPVFRKIGEVANRQVEILKSENSLNTRAYMFSDFQKNAEVFKPDTTIPFILIPLASAENRNVSIDSCWFAEPIQLSGQSNKVLVKLTNHGSEAIANQRMVLKVNTQTKALAEVSLEAGQSRIDTLAFVMQNPGWNQAEITLEDFPIIFDDKYYLTFNVLEKINVLHITPNGSSPFVSNVFKGDAAFQSTTIPVSSLDYSSFGNYNFISVENVNNISSGLLSALQKFISEGGNVIMFPAKTAQIEEYNRFLTSINACSLGAYLEQMKELNALNKQQKIIQTIFDKIPENLSLPSVRQSYALLTSSTSNQENIITFKDQSPFLSRFPYKQGNLFLCASPLESAASDFQGSPLFAPIIYTVAIQSSRAENISFFIGSKNLIEVKNKNGGGEQVFKLKGNKVEFIPEQFMTGNKVFVKPGDQVKEAGFYSISKDKSEEQTAVGINYNRQESALEFYNTGELKTLMPQSSVSVLESLEGGASTLAKEAEAGTPLWKWCIFLALLFLGAEVLMLRFMK